VEPAQGPLHRPAVDAQSAAMLRPTLSQEGDNAPFPQLSPMGPRVIGPVALDRLGTPSRPSHFARDGRHGIDQRQQLRDVMAVGPGDLDGQRDSIGRGQDMVLGACFAAIRGIGTCMRPPKTARTELESIGAREKSIWSAPRSSLSKTRWIWFQRPAFCQSRSRRQQVMPLPQPISWGRYSQGMPVLRTNKMPVNAARLDRGFRPGYRKRLFFTGNNGPIRFHNRSSNNGFISSSLYLSSWEAEYLLATDIYTFLNSFC